MELFNPRIYSMYVRKFFFEEKETDFDTQTVRIYFLDCVIDVRIYVRINAMMKHFARSAKFMVEWKKNASYVKLHFIVYR